MIIREREKHFVMIEQHHHARISGHLYEFILADLKLQDAKVYTAVREAIYLHDIGWKPFDASPIWNDETGVPYDFITYPNSIKTVLYKQGIDTVAETSNYAALLCSEHYVRFLENDPSALAKRFVHIERARQQNIIDKYDNFNYEAFLSHYELLQFFDNLSLYICLHEPYSIADDIHYFFKKGIQLPTLYGSGRLQLKWKGHTIKLEHSLFHELQTIHLKQKIVAKSDIKKVGLKKAWEHTEIEVVSLTMK